MWNNVCTADLNYIWSMLCCPWSHQFRLNMAVNGKAVQQRTVLFFIFLWSLKHNAIRLCNIILRILLKMPQDFHCPWWAIYCTAYTLVYNVRVFPPLSFGSRTGLQQLEIHDLAQEKKFQACSCVWRKATTEEPEDTAMKDKVFDWRSLGALYSYISWETCPITCVQS